MNRFLLHSVYKMAISINLLNPLKNNNNQFAVHTIQKYIGLLQKTLSVSTYYNKYDLLYSQPCHTVSNDFIKNIHN